jgi:hypothetical protein
MRGGNLRERFDVIVLPSESPGQIRSGRPAGSVPPEYTGGLGSAGVETLRAFLRAGGTVVALEQASLFAIEDLAAPATVVLGGRGPRDAQTAVRFSAPGSIFEVAVDVAHPVASGMDSVAALYFDSSPILDAAPGGHAIASYRREGSPLLSGFVQGAEMLAGGTDRGAGGRRPRDPVRLQPPAPRPDERDIQAVDERNPVRRGAGGADGAGAVG